ncbi:type II secretion system F family protein [Streptomyces sp. NPDC097619]|uniref:type II secretion system F family protein n=1 Tax=Streptomyces sp. NPDC097619 TaxID=3157228 RepID=UPI00332711B1
MTGAGALLPAVLALCALAVGPGGGGTAVARRAGPLFAGGSAVPGPAAGVRARVARAAGALRGRREWAAPALGLLVAVAAASPVPLLLGVAAVPLVRRRSRAAAAARARRERAAEVIALCAFVAGESRAGLQPGQALSAALRGPVPGPGGAEAAVLAAAAFGGDVPRALRQAAREPGAEGLAGLAACWQVSVDGGAGLAAGLERLEAALRAERDQAESLRAQLAGVRSTAVVLALLPVLALLIGTALGADPLRVLFHTAPGLGCLLAGAVLEALGLLWVRRIVRTGART